MSGAPTTQPWCGTLDLVYAQRRGITQPIHNLAQAPLKIQRPFHPEGAVCHSVLLHTAGGIVGGDRLTIRARLEPESHALLTTAAASKLYRSNGFEAQQRVHLDVGAGACVEWLPQESIVFDGAVYRQDLRVELAPDAWWFGWELTRLGRSARGERFVQGNWRSHTEVWRQGQPLWIDRQWLPGNPAWLDSPHGLHGRSLVGSFAVVGQPIAPELVAEARALWQGRGEVGVTRLMAGMLCRYRGDSTEEARAWMLRVWDLLRQALIQRPACPPRVWPL